MCKNKLIIAAAGSGKTTYLVKEALEVKDKNVLVTTFTEANEEEIRKNFFEQKGYIPTNITINTWFSFLMRQGVRPYQSVMNDQIHEAKIGFYLTEEPSGYRYSNRNGRPVYWGENNFYEYYFTKNLKIYSDKISKFIVECNKKTKGEIIRRISRIYPYIFIDEVQDLAGWELEILKSLFETSASISLVGDPRQVTYLTHHPKKHAKYKDGKIDKFINEKCKKNTCAINTEILSKTHRNNALICNFSSRLFPDMLPCFPCMCEKCRSYKINHEGVFIIKEADVKKYCEKYSPTILREKQAVFPEWNYGKSKGLTFDRVLIYPTNPILNWIKDNNSRLAPMSRCKFYVAVTRAKYSVGIVYNYADDEEIDGVDKFVVS